MTNFNSQKKKWDKELGKTLQRLANMASNKPLDEGIEKEGGEKNEEEAASSLTQRAAISFAL